MVLQVSVFFNIVILILKTQLLFTLYLINLQKARVKVSPLKSLCVSLQNNNQ